MKTLTIFTPTYNRKHTLLRTYESLCCQTKRDFDWFVIDDGSSDGTREWIESLGSKTITSGQRFDWMGRIMEGEDENHFVILAPNVRIEYVYKSNGGLYTGYNVAYQAIQTELCVCIDSDDYMPDDAVEKIIDKWCGLNEVEKLKYCGIVGLDFNIATKRPIGGKFPENVEDIYFSEINHSGDTKPIFRTDLMRIVAPMIGFEGERDFNPHYMQINVMDKFPILLLNEVLCCVEYQIGGDSMSQGIWRQYVRSPRSYAKYRINQMTLLHGNSLKNKFRLCIHYVSSCILSKDKQWLVNSPLKLITILSIPLGVLLTFIVKFKNRK